MEFDGINDVTSIPTQNGEYIYITGKFDSYSEAKSSFNAGCRTRL